MTPDSTPPDRQPPPEDDDVLDIELEEEEAPQPLPAVSPFAADDVLDVTLDDEPDAGAPATAAVSAPEAAYPAVTEFPAVTAEQAIAAKPGVAVPCVCSATRQHFDVRYEEQEPGVFWAAETVKTAAKETKGGLAAAQGAVQGNFRMGPDYVCPYCGDGSLTLCERCQTVLCLGATDKTGGCQCPACSTVLTPTGPLATSAPTRGKGKGKAS
jgi:hypothetical protein